MCTAATDKQLCNIKVGSGDREHIGWLRRQQRKIADGLERFVEKYYRPALKFAIRHRYSTVVSFTGILAIMLATRGRASAGSNAPSYSAVDKTGHR